MLINILSLLVFLMLVALAAGRGLMLRRRGINAFVFGVTDKSDFLLMPVVAFFFYSILAAVIGLPMPGVLKQLLFQSAAAGWTGIAVCCGSLIWFALTLRSFGTSFRIGIDEATQDKLVTSGMFGISRNPIYIAFLAFLAGMILIYPNLAACAAFILFAAAIHRQVIREEKFLRSHYSQEYEDYCRRVRRYL